MTSFREVLEKMLVIVVLPVRNTLRRENELFSSHLVSNTCGLLASIVSELTASALGSEVKFLKFIPRSRWTDILWKSYRLWQWFYQCTYLSEILELFSVAFRHLSFLKAYIFTVSWILLKNSYFIMAEEYCNFFNFFFYKVSIFLFCMHTNASTHSKYIVLELIGGSATSQSVSLPLILS